MKRVTVLLILIILLPLQNIAQYSKTSSVDVKMGPLEKRKKRTTHNEFIAWDNDWFIVSKYYKGWTLEKYNDKMSKIFEGVIKFPKSKMELSVQYFIFIKDKLYIVYKKANNREKTMWLCYQTINTSTLTLNGDEKEFAEIEWVVRGQYHLQTYYSISPDKSKLIVYHNLPTTSSGKEGFGVIVFDRDMKVIWDKKIKMPYLDKEFHREGLRVDNKGTFYLFGTRFNNRKKREAKRDGKPNYKYHIFRVTENEKIKDITVSLGDKFITDMQLGLLDDNTLVCAGFYSDVGKLSIKGSYFLKIDGVSGKITKKSMKEFDLDFITQNMSEKAEKKTKKKASKGKNVEMYEYDLDNLEIRDDGGAVLIAEQYYVRTVTTTTYTNGVASTQTTYYYYYNDIIVVNFSPDGNIDWAVKIPKRQVSKNDHGYYLGYAFANTKNKLFFAFHDHPKNQLKNSSIDKTYGVSGKGEVMTLAVVDMKGKVKMGKLYNHKYKEAYTRPKTGEQLFENELYLYLQGGRGKQRYAKLILK